MKTVITQQGLNLLNQTKADGTTQYWIGYYGLAYVPEENRVSEDSSDATDAISSNMNSLTTSGDMIYNVFQGSMTPVGLDTDIGESAAYRLYNECMYSASVISKFRYVLDENENNQLVVFRDRPETSNSSAGLQEYVTYYGVNTSKASNMPIPAPLYYQGEPYNYDSIPSDIQSAITATIANVPNNTKTGISSPDSSSAASLLSYDTRAIISNTSAVAPGIGSDESLWTNNPDKYSWASSDQNTYVSNVSTLPDPDKPYLKSAWQHQSVSNFNRFHASANTTGYAVGYEPSTRNIAKATKYFPIAHYDVINSADDTHVSSVKYTVSIDLSNVYDGVTKRSTAYYDENGTPVTSDVAKEKYKVGFKFNRIGIYAVPVTLHSYNTDEYNTDCKYHNIQMQISGNTEPTLFAVMDLPSPVVLSEDGMHQYEISFQLNFTTDSTIVNESAIYYNLYESDAITWYKNQLIANASISEAVTTLGVQLNYLQNKMNLVSGSSTVCGTGDDGNKYALSSHTHNYMKNIVDSIKDGNGAVRGIYTKDETNANLLKYKSNGRTIVQDADGTVHYNDNSGDEVPKLIESASAIVGDYSMNLGNNSATYGTYSINMSDGGYIVNDDDSVRPTNGKSRNVLLMGSINTTSVDSLNDHIVVKDTRNSFISVAGTTEIEKMDGSLWIGTSNGNYAKIYVDHPVSNSIGIGSINIYDKDITQSIYPGSPSNNNEFTSFVGNLDVYAPATLSMIYGYGERNSKISVGKVDLMSAFNIDNYLSHQGTAEIFDYVASSRSVSWSVLTGFASTFGRNITSTLSLGSSNCLSYNVSNSIIIGVNNNKQQAKYRPYKYFTVDEFNERYSNKIVADDDYMFSYGDSSSISSENYTRSVVVGTGDISAMNKDGTTVTYSVNGVSLYIAYDNVGQYATNRWMLPTASDINLSVAYAYKPAGNNLKNMVIIGDDNNVGYNSANSIVIGDKSSEWKAITYKNSFISSAGCSSSDVTSAFIRADDNHPTGIFNNVWWIGHQYSNYTPLDYSVTTDTTGDRMDDRKAGHFLAEQFNSFKQYEFSDVFAFVGRNTRQYSFSAWYGADNYLANNELMNRYYTEKDLYQPCKAPMIYSGGIAMGGYGTSDSNFMLLKLGINGCWPDHTLYYPKMDEVRANMWRPDPTSFRNIIYLKNGNETDQEPTQLNEYGSFDLYDDLCSDGIHHLQVNSPYAGMSLVVQEKQELDGTLHVGLGNSGGTDVLTDFDPSIGYKNDTTELYPILDNHTFIYQSWKDTGVNKVLVKKSNSSRFMTPSQDMGRYHSGGTIHEIEWYSAYPWYNFEPSTTTLDWYFWYAYTDYEEPATATGYTASWRVNRRRNLIVSSSTLMEGIVYEINMHVVRIPGPDTRTMPDGESGFTTVYAEQASPVTSLYNPGTLDCEYFGKPTISFYTHSGHEQIIVHPWGNADVSYGNLVYPIFYATAETNTHYKDITGQVSNEYHEMATAKLLFTRIKNDIYIMEY